MMLMVRVADVAGSAFFASLFFNSSIGLDDVSPPALAVDVPLGVVDGTGTTATGLAATGGGPSSDDSRFQIFQMKKMKKIKKK